MKGYPEYPNLGATIAKYRRRYRKLDAEGRREYGNAVLEAIRRLQLNALRRVAPPHSCPCPSGTWDSDGETILRKIAKQHATALASKPTKDEVERANKRKAFAYANWLAKRDGIEIPPCPKRRVITEYSIGVVGVAYGRMREVYNTRKDGRRGAWLYNEFAEEFRINFPTGEAEATKLAA